LSVRTVEQGCGHSGRLEKEEGGATGKENEISFLVLDLSRSALCTSISIHCFQSWYTYMLNVPQKFVW